MPHNILYSPQPFELESGQSLPHIDIAYHTYGRPNEDGSNVVWICHALTGNSDPTSWWQGAVGKGKIFDPDIYFIVCANVIGSCYGSIGPAAVNPLTGQQYRSAFPHVSIRDMVHAHELLRTHLGIERIHCLVGASLGGQQAIEWAIQQPEVFDRLILIATNARHSAWGIAFNTAQRLALEADPTFGGTEPDAGRKGLTAARAIGMLSYRSYETFLATQSGSHDSGGYLAESYLRYQGEKLVKRFDVYSYHILTHAMDGHDIGRGRGEISDVLQSIRARTLAIGISSDLLFPPQEQQFIAQHIPNASYAEIQSLYGHDGFLVEYDQLQQYVGNFLDDKTGPPVEERYSFTERRKCA